MIGVDRASDVERGGCELEQRAQEHPGSLPQPGEPRGQVGVLSEGVRSGSNNHRST